MSMNFWALVFPVSFFSTIYALVHHPGSGLIWFPEGNCQALLWSWFLLLHGLCTMSLHLSSDFCPVWVPVQTVTWKCRSNKPFSSQVALVTVFHQGNSDLNQTLCSPYFVPSCKLPRGGAIQSCCFKDEVTTLKTFVLSMVVNAPSTQEKEARWSLWIQLGLQSVFQGSQGY